MGDRIKPTISLTIICLVSAFLLAIVNQMTAPTIAARQEQAKAEQRQMVMPEAEKFVKHEDQGDLQPGSLVQAVFIAQKGDAVIGYVFDVVSNGFGGPVNVTVGVNMDLQITGLRVGENSETAGLGSRAANPDFYEQFKDKSGDPPLTVNESGQNNIDGLTSATITSRAVTTAAQSAWECAKALINKGA